MTICGCKCSSKDGSVERKRLPISSCAGDAMLSTGVFLYSSRFRYGFCPDSLAFSRIFFAVCTVLSANPFDCGYFGLDVMCLKSKVLANVSNFVDENCGPLSLITVEGIPCRAKCVDNFSMMNFDVVCRSALISKKRL